MGNTVRCTGSSVFELDVSARSPAFDSYITHVNYCILCPGKTTLMMPQEMPADLSGAQCAKLTT